jgi:hypothetical protein
MPDVVHDDEPDWVQNLRAAGVPFRRGSGPPLSREPDACFPSPAEFYGGPGGRLGRAFRRLFGRLSRKAEHAPRPGNRAAVP